MAKAVRAAALVVALGVVATGCTYGEKKADTGPTTTRLIDGTDLDSLGLAPLASGFELQVARQLSVPEAGVGEYSFAAGAPPVADLVGEAATVGRAPGDEADRTAVAEGVSYVSPTGWKEWGRSTNWVILGTGDAAGQATIQAEQLDGQAEARDLIRFELERNVAAFYTEVQSSEVQDVDPARIGPEVTDAASVVWQGVIPATESQVAVPVEAWVIALTLDDNRIVLFSTVNIQGRRDEFKDDFSALFSSLRFAPVNSTDPTATTAPPPTTAGDTTAPPDTSGSANPITGPQVETGPDGEWANYLIGVWVARQPQGGDDLWTFDPRSYNAIWSFWPEGYDPTGSQGREIPTTSSAGPYRVIDGDLVVVTPNLTRIYRGLRPTTGGCWAGTIDGRDQEFCRPQF